MNLVVHRYLQETKINKQPPGFADFLRGTITLYQYAKQYNYQIKFDINSHPIFKFLNIPDYLSINIDKNINTIELTPPIDYKDMDNILRSLFITNNNLCILTNAFYNEKSDMIDEYIFAQSFLKPSKELEEFIENKKNEIKLDFSKPYIIIHARLGDQYLVNKNSVNYDIINRIREHIHKIKTENIYKQIIFIADSKEIKEFVNDLCFITNSFPIHTGSLDIQEIDERLMTTLFEFFLMSKSEKIYCLNYWDGSGFSRICARIFGKPYIPINI
jgi:hypothetical protein